MACFDRAALEALAAEIEALGEGHVEARLREEPLDLSVAVVDEDGEAGANHVVCRVAGRWYVYLHTNVYFEVPSTANLAEVSCAIVDTSDETPYSIAPEVMDEFGLRRLDGEPPA